MYKPLYILFLLLIISFGSSKAQNLVYNGDFEIFDTCPVTLSQPGDLQIEHCTGWTAPTKLGTSDYFNVCNISSNVGIPNNYAGYQQAYNGNGYVGMHSWDAVFFPDYREYIQTKLIHPLMKGKKYKLTFFISAEGSNYALEKIGAVISINNFYANNYNPIIATPQILNQNGFLTDSVNWTKIEGEFIADGGEEYLTIGYFEPSNTMTDTLNIYNAIFAAKSVYYLIDGVELFESNYEVIIPNIITPNGDGTNDLFQLNFPVIKTEIYNRWGQKLFESNNNESYWNGRTTAGNEVPEGTYYYIIVTEEETYKGYLQLLR